MVDEVETLIDIVQEYYCIWRLKSKSYKDQRAKENAWKMDYREFLKQHPAPLGDLLETVLM